MYYHRILMSNQLWKDEESNINHTQFKYSEVIILSIRLTHKQVYFMKNHKEFQHCHKKILQNVWQHHKFKSEYTYTTLCQRHYITVTAEFKTHFQCWCQCKLYTEVSIWNMLQWHEHFNWFVFIQFDRIWWKIEKNTHYINLENTFFILYVIWHSDSNKSELVEWTHISHLT